MGELLTNVGYVSLRPGTCLPSGALMTVHEIKHLGASPCYSLIWQRREHWIMHVLCLCPRGCWDKQG